MATAATARSNNASSSGSQRNRPPVPQNYFCRSCGLRAHHWIMDCSVLPVFRKDSNVLTSEEDNKTNEELPDELVQIACSGVITECQSLERILGTLQFYQTHAQNEQELLTYFERYKYLLNDYTHILSVHLDQEKEMNDMNGAVIYNKITQLVKCDVNSCPFYSRDPLIASPALRSLPSPSHTPSKKGAARRAWNQTEIERLIFYRNTLNTIHCYFLHPFHTGFRMVKSASFDRHANPSGAQITWNDQELHHLQRELYDRRENLLSVADHSDQSYRYSKFIIDISDKYEHKKSSPKKESKQTPKLKSKTKGKSKEAVSMQQYFGARHYYWKWYKKHDKEDWRCNPGRSFKELYIAPKYDNLKDEILQNQHCTLKSSEFNVVLIKAMNYMKSSQVIRTFKAEGDRLLHYGIEDGEGLAIDHLIAIILHTDFKQLATYFVKTFRKLNASESEDAFKRRKSEYHFWSKHLRETVELYGTPVHQSKIRTFYVCVSAQLAFPAFSARFCLPTSTTSQLQIASMCTKNGMILELKAMSETTQFFQANLKYFNCELVSAFGEEHERLFIGGWAELRLANVRVLVERKENYFPFMKAINHFANILDGEESEYNERYQGATTSHMSRINSIASDCSEALSCIDHEGVDCKSPEFVGSGVKNRNHIRHHKVESTEQSEKGDKLVMMDSIIIDNLCQSIIDGRRNKEYPELVQEWFLKYCMGRDKILINLKDLRTNYNCFMPVLLSSDCDGLVKFDSLYKIFKNCREIIVDMNTSQPLSAHFWISFCKQMVKITANKTKRHKLEKIVLLKVKRGNVSLDIWQKIQQKYHKYEAQIWYQSLSAFRYNSDEQLVIFFEQKPHEQYVKEQKDADHSVSHGLSSEATDSRSMALVASNSNNL